MPRWRPDAVQRSPTASPLAPRRGSINKKHELDGTDELVSALKTISWFQGLPDNQLRILAKRGRLEWCDRYRTIIREGNRGRYFYILLRGQVHCTSAIKKGLSVRLGAVSAFGEGALVTTVQREATVAALEPCHLMLLSSEDMAGLDVELATVKQHVISLILESLPFFRDLTKSQQDELGLILDLTYHERSTTLFEEDDSGDALYVLIEGVVQMYKRSADDLLIGTFFAKSERPWFGEMALMGNGKKRTCAAVCKETCKLLTLHLKDFSRFFEIVPSFQQMLVSSAKSYRTLDAMRIQNASNDDVIKSGLAFLSNPVNVLLNESIEGFQMAESKDEDEESEPFEVRDAIVERWKGLTTGLLAKARLIVAAATDTEPTSSPNSFKVVSGGSNPSEGTPSQMPSAPPGATGRRRMTVRRVSYVAGGERAIRLAAEQHEAKLQAEAAAAAAAAAHQAEGSA